MMILHIVIIIIIIINRCRYQSTDVAVVLPPACRLRLLRCVVVARSDILYGLRQNTCRQSSHTHTRRHQLIHAYGRAALIKLGLLHFTDTRNI